MDWLKEVTAEKLHEEIRRLERDIDDFRGRASKQRAAVEREGRYWMSDPLYQRLASIRDHLQDQLKQTQDELERRERVPAKPSTYLSLRAAVAGWLGATG